MSLLTRMFLTCFAALALVPLTAVAASAAPSAVGVAVDERGMPLKNVYWELYEKQGGEWVGLQYGPKLTDANGRFSVEVKPNTGYRVCFSDSYYGPVDGTPSGFWQPEIRHHDVCWPNATTVETAQTWTSGTDGTRAFTMTLPKEGLGMAPVDPFVLGAFEVGKPLTVVGQEGWRPTNATLSYQWFSDGDVIPGATSASYTPTAAVADTWIYAGVTATLPGYKPATLWSQTNKVGTPHAQLTAPLTISGTAAAGHTLTASFGEPAGDSYSELRWFVDGVPQPDATTYDRATSTFAVTPAMAGARIDVRLSTYLIDGSGNYTDGSSTYGRVAVQVAGTRPAQALSVSRPPATTSGPAGGTVAVGSTLVAPSDLTADPAATTTYQWLRDSAAIAGATASTYRLQPVDVGHRIAVAVTVGRPGWWSSYVGVSPASGAVRGILPAGRVKVTGKARAGAKLKAKVTGWSGTSLRYQWLRNGKPIKPAKKSTKASYKLTKKDLGKRITVRVTAAKPFYDASSVTSKATKIRRR